MDGIILAVTVGQAAKMLGSLMETLQTMPVKALKRATKRRTVFDITSSTTVENNLGALNVSNDV